jgi:hypothetical protein
MTLTVRHGDETVLAQLSAGTGKSYVNIDNNFGLLDGFIQTRLTPRLSQTVELHDKFVLISIKKDDENPFGSRLIISQTTSSQRLTQIFHYTS